MSSFTLPWQLERAFILFPLLFADTLTALACFKLCKLLAARTSHFSFFFFMYDLTLFISYRNVRAFMNSFSVKKQSTRRASGNGTKRTPSFCLYMTTWRQIFRFNFAQPCEAWFYPLPDKRIDSEQQKKCTGLRQRRSERCRVYYGFQKKSFSFLDDFPSQKCWLTKFIFVPRSSLGPSGFFFRLLTSFYATFPLCVLEKIINTSVIENNS